MDFTALKTAIQNAVKLNGNEEITGDILQGVLLSMVTTLGDSAINDLVTAISNEATARQNGDSTLNGYITALQGAVNSINTAIENGFVYAGIATPTTTPATGKVFYIALTAGTYTNFGNTEVSQGINILKYNGSAWSLDVVIALDDAPTSNSNNLVKSGGVFEMYHSVNLSGLQTGLLNAWIGNDGVIHYQANENYKVLVCVVDSTKSYMYYSGVFNASNGAIYAFYDSSMNFIESHGISEAGWLDIVPPSGAKYFIANIKFASIFTQAQTNSCCFVEKTKWISRLLAKESDDIVKFDNIQSVLNDITYISSLNIFEGKTENGWLNQQGSVVPTNNNYVTTDFIPVKPNTYYRLSGRGQGQTLADDAVVGYGTDKTTKYAIRSPNGVYPLASVTSPYYLWNNNGNHQMNGGFKTNENTYFIRMTIRWNGTPSSNWDKIMLEELGAFYDYEDETPTPYQPYAPVIKITDESLPLELSILKGKKIAYNGDSICESRLTYAFNGGAYPVLISELTESTFENRAKSGGILSNNPNYGDETTRRIVDDVVNMASDADLICFEGGVNDWSGNIPLGTFSQHDFDSSFDKTTICGALESIFRQAINKWVGKPIVFIICHKVAGSGNNNQLGFNFYDVHDKMVGICKKWGIPYYDAFASAPLNGDIAALNNAYLNGGDAYPNPDGWHPNKAGYERYYVPQLLSLFESLLKQ